MSDCRRLRERAPPGGRSPATNNLESTIMSSRLMKTLSRQGARYQARIAFQNWEQGMSWADALIDLKLKTLETPNDKQTRNYTFRTSIAALEKKVFEEFTTVVVCTSTHTNPEVAFQHCKFMDDFFTTDASQQQQEDDLYYV